MANATKDHKKKYKGVIVPMITPFTQDLNIDKEAIGRIVTYLIQNNCAIFLLGTTGESLSVSHSKRYALVDYTVKAANGRQTIYAGISGNCFEDTVENAERFNEIGVDAVVAHLPSYYPLTDTHILRYFEKLADAVPLPLILYNMPATTYHSMSTEIIDHLSYHDNIIGLKDSEREEERLDRSLKLWKDRKDFAFYLGWAAKSSYGLRNGLDGIVPSTGNLVPGLYSQLFSAAQKNDFKKAEELQKITNEISAFYQDGNLLSESVPRLKAMMNAFGLCEPHVAAPMIATLEQVQAEVLKKFGKYNTHIVSKSIILKKNHE